MVETDEGDERMRQGFELERGRFWGTVRERMGFELEDIFARLLGC